MKRTQIYLDERQDNRLEHLSAATGQTKSRIIREAVETYLAGEDIESRRLDRLKAVAVDLQRTPIQSFVEGGEAFVNAARRADERRADDLDRQWRN